MSADTLGLSSLHKFMFDGMAVRGALVRISDEWRKLLHQRSADAAHAPSVRRVLGEMTAASALLQANIKFDGTLIMQLFGDGPLKLAVVEMHSDLRFRSTAKVNGSLPSSGMFEAMANLHGQGRCSITLEPRRGAGLKQSYQGIVPLNRADGGSLQSIAQMIELYMEQSEQLQSKLILAADETVATGLLIQRLPAHGGRQVTDPSLQHMDVLDSDAQDENFNRLSLLAASLTPEELLHLEPAEVLRRLYWDEPCRIVETLAGGTGPRFHCTCSAERVRAMLRSIGQVEVEDILREQGRVEIGCEFCGKQYVFDAVDAGELFVEQENHPPGSRQVQ